MDLKGRLLDNAQNGLRMLRDEDFITQQDYYDILKLLMEKVENKV